ncbi:enoyl-CoA hydratase/isomerase family protein [Desulfosporosinus shakirovi]|uniref:enoyl-CoA hydratase/isomerase family protein n=1 Tax=Desulfosporosinus shakirovi TaxID=2885154 RepID=UPI001E4F2AD1|nr:enoyl-CoA hydratase-related protein [Desulfosporosinus sp. SRJS8]MCB8817146.1 enoyl-CoA hydratase/isomerase family protein [Desulfosporosinus sp. SRJS8]
MARRECLKFIKTPQEDNNNHLLYQKDGFLARIILNRPEKYNAFSLPMIRKWAEALQDAQEDPNIRVIVVTAKGKAFSTGGDVEAMLKGKGFVGCDDQSEAWGDKAIDRKRALTNHIHKIALTLEMMDKPVICGINGIAIGAGLDMALMCDIRVAAEDVQLSAGYVKAGIVPGDGGAFYLPRLVGIAKALEILWTGDYISAHEAKEIGMINKVVPALELEQATLELARKIADSPPVCVQMIKRAVYSAQRTNDLRTALDLISSQMAIVSEMSDHKEGLNAIIEKRKPIFTGQ